MKRKILLFLLVFCAVFSLASCGKKEMILYLKDYSLTFVIEYDFKSFEDLEYGNYEVIVTHNYNNFSDVFPAVLSVSSETVNPGTENEKTYKKYHLTFIQDEQTYTFDVTDEVLNTSDK